MNPLLSYCKMRSSFERSLIETENERNFRHFVGKGSKVKRFVLITQFSFTKPFRYRIRSNLK